MAGAYWKVSCTLPEAIAQTMEQAFDGLSFSISAFETDEARKLWTVELLCDRKPDMAEIERRVALLSVAHRFPKPVLAMARLQQQDWLKVVAQSFPPLFIGRFYIHGAHVKKRPPAGSIALQVDAGAAFGSGEHGTTGTCLEALDWLAKQHDFSNVLDMGCGSGILAIAGAKLWPCEVLAADVDPVAVAVARDNARINRVQLEAIVSDGYAHERIKRRAPFDLIVSNILARPLIAFAPALAQHLQSGGFAVLSGLLASQEAQVKNAHMKQGMKFVRHFADGDWRTLVLRKK